jgi:hypothetical protein
MNTFHFGNCYRPKKVKNPVLTRDFNPIPLSLNSALLAYELCGSTEKLRVGKKALSQSFLYEFEILFYNKIAKNGLEMV